MGKLGIGRGFQELGRGGVVGLTRGVCRRGPGGNRERIVVVWDGMVWNANCAFVSPIAGKGGSDSLFDAFGFLVWIGRVKP